MGLMLFLVVNQNIRDMIKKISMKLRLTSCMLLSNILPLPKLLNQKLISPI